MTPQLRQVRHLNNCGTVPTATARPLCERRLLRFYCHR